jgi:hypothetical protein
MPDIIGMRLRMTPAEARAALQKHYPRQNVSTQTFSLEPYLPPTQPVLQALYVGYQILGAAAQDRAVVHFTPPPGSPVAWRIRRDLNRQQMDHANVIASLREKYGAETYAINGNGTYSPVRAGDDASIWTMWWVLDAQGRSVKVATSGQIGGDLLQCARTFTDERDEPGAPPFTADVADPQWERYRFGGRPEWCRSGMTLLRAQMDPPTPIVQVLSVEVIDIGAALAAARAEAQWMQGIANRQQQQQLDRAKQNKPQL